ncbi:MAG TPA: M28 family peptidase [Ktedonobacterales bacterium]
MRWRSASTVRVLLALGICALLLSSCQLRFGDGTPANTTPIPALAQDFPAVDPGFIYDQLDHMATSYLHRESGYDTSLPPDQNGHDEFAAYWAQEMTSLLAGFGPTVTHDSFSVDGWVNRPAQTSAFNVEVTVPGVSHPEQIVVIGCHYDGEAVSTQSANDDASGCAIELGVAKALADYWRAHALYPARTLKFVIFDAEEQGVFGSFHYVNATINGELGQVVAMINEEQSGIAYPLRFLGNSSDPVLPEYASVSPLTNSQLYPDQTHLSAVQKNAVTQFESGVQQSLVPVFEQFRALGYSSLGYSGATLPIFDDTSHVVVQPDKTGGSDQIPFTLAGLPCVTLVGNSTYYDNNPPPWSYPFDQPQDTLQMMNVFASGHTAKSEALQLSLALPGMLTTWMLHQSAVLGEVPADGKPIAAISDIGATQIGAPLSLDAHSAYLAGRIDSLSYAWEFGDGAKATGVAVTHTYSSAGAYTLTLSINSSAGARTISVPLTVSGAPPRYDNPYAAFPQDGKPPVNHSVSLPPLVP